jgi:hypothetical protein
MSEYQYYEFLAIDRPLSNRQMDELRGLSSRATITSTHFQNVYNYGDFRGKPEVLMEKYFDAFVYVANWGTRRFMLRLPESLLDRETTSLYCSCDALDVHWKDGFAILEFLSEDEERGEWEDGEGWMESLVPVREDLASGDLRALYLGWLLCAQNGSADDDQIEPPVPPGLGALSEPLKSLAKFLWIDEDLIAVAAELSAPHRNEKPSSQEIEQWVIGLPESVKNSLLLRLAAGEANLGAGLIQQLRRSRTQGVEAALREGTRTVAALRAAAEAHAEKRRQEEKRREAEERVRLAREREAARVGHLRGLVGREEQLWQQVEELVEKKQARECDQATQLVKDLHDLAAGSQQIEDFHMRLNQLRQKYAGRPSFLKRLDAANLKTAA